MKKKNSKIVFNIVASMVLATLAAGFFAHYYKPKASNKPLVTCLYGSTTVFDEVTDKTIVNGSSITMFRANGTVVTFTNVSCRVLYPNKVGQYIQ